MDDSQNHLVFISHAKCDRETAQIVCQQLAGIGVSCGLSGVGEAKAVLLLFSKAADESSEVQTGIANAIERKLPLVSIRVDDHDPTGSLESDLKDVPWLDASDADIDEHTDVIGECVLTVLLDQLNVEDWVLHPVPVKPLPPAVIMNTGLGVSMAEEAVELLQRLIAETEADLEALDPDIKEHRGPAYCECVDRIDSLGDGLQLAEQVLKANQFDLAEVRQLIAATEEAFDAGSLKTTILRLQQAVQKAVAGRVQDEDTWHQLRDLDVQVLDSSEGVVRVSTAAEREISMSELVEMLSRSTQLVSSLREAMDKPDESGLIEEQGEIEKPIAAELPEVVEMPMAI